MSLVRHISQILRINTVYKSPVSWTRVMSSPSTPVPTKPDESKATSKPTSTSDDPLRNRASYKPDNLEKKFLVWTGKYKSVEEVPEYINQETMERTRNKIRIKGANIMIVLTILGCVYAVYSGKKAAEGGESVEKYNLDWHKKYNESKAK